MPPGIPQTARNNFLATNTHLVDSIEARLGAIRTAAEADRELRLGWLPGFEATWAEICEQQGWGATQPTRLGRLFERMLAASPSFLSDRLSVNKSRRARPYHESAVFNEPDATFTVEPESTGCETAYGFRLLTSGTDMWHPFATGHYKAELVETTPSPTR